MITKNHVMIIGVLFQYLNLVMVKMVLPIGKRIKEIIIYHLDCHSLICLHCNCEFHF